MVSRNLFFIVLLFTFGCSQPNHFPTQLSEKVDSNIVQLTTVLPVYNFNNSDSKIARLEELTVFSKQYSEKNDRFSLDQFRQKWFEIYRTIDLEITNSSDLQQWFKISGLLMELTGEAVFLAELERLTLLGLIKSEQVASYVFTKNLDNVFVNIFTPSIIEYQHTTGGEVKIEMDTDYPKSGKINLKFNMTERRYMEVNIRIPDWAEGATVTVKRVKYFAAPGTYCKIAKKWKEDDLVEIVFPDDRIPEFLK